LLRSSCRAGSQDCASFFQIGGWHGSGSQLQGQHFQRDANLVVMREFCDIEVADEASLLRQNAQIPLGFKAL